jgi:hypothetical protein
MRAGVLFPAAWLVAGAVGAAELKFDFHDVPEGGLPAGFRSTVSGEGKPGRWQVVLDEVPPGLAPVTPQAQVVTRKAVLAQLARDITDEHFPLLIYEGEPFGDFTFTTRFKTVGGAIERMAGLAFRIQDERNYYVVRASSLGNSFRFYKFVDGQRSKPVGPEIEIPSGQWHELTVECRGNQIRCLLNGTEAIPTLTDSSFAAGKIGFWTKSDSVSYFADARIVYVPREKLAQVLVRESLRKYPRLAGLKICVPAPGPAGLQVIAGTDQQEVGQPADPAFAAVLDKNAIIYSKSSGKATVTLPLHDRNGDTVAAVSVILDSFPGQTEQNAIGRATPVVRFMQSRMIGARSLTE